MNSARFHTAPRLLFSCVISTPQDVYRPDGHLGTATHISTQSFGDPDSPGELQLRIVDHITLKSDLRSLCETCSALRVLANPILYRRIVLRLWSRRAVDRLLQSNLAGAGLHFQHTKELIIEDEPVGEELRTVHAGRVRPPILDRLDDALNLSDAEKDDTAYSFLQIMHHNQLERLWYHSQRPLSPIVKTHLRHYQTRIQDLQISLYTDPGSPQVLPRIFCGLQRLDLYVNGSASIILLFHNIEVVGANLRSLSLTAARYEHINTDLEAWAMGEENSFTHFTPKLEELTLHYFGFDGAFAHFAKIVNFRRLVRLELLGGSGGAQFFLADLADSIKDDERLHLKHIAIDLAGDFDQDDVDDMKDTLSLICEASDPLESFHIRTPGGGDAPIDLYQFLAKLNPSGHELSSLSFHSDLFNWAEWNQDAMILLMRVFIEPSLRAVKQLAVYFPEDAMLMDPDDSGAHYPILVKSLQGFYNLRLLHLRLPHFESMGRTPKSEWFPLILTSELQTFANRLFQDLDGGFSKLEALVIGHMAALKHIDNMHHQHPVPQQCFVRGEQRDMLGRTVTVAVPVTRMMLRETQPYTDILEIDHYSASTAYEAWAARRM